MLPSTPEATDKSRLDVEPDAPVARTVPSQHGYGVLLKLNARAAAIAVTLPDTEFGAVGCETGPFTARST